MDSLVKMEESTSNECRSSIEAVAARDAGLVREGALAVAVILKINSQGHGESVEPVTSVSFLPIRSAAGIR